MNLFFAVIIHMCLVKKQKIKRLPVNKQLHSHSIFRISISRNRFTAILSHLHVNDNATYVPRNEPGHDPLHKIRPFLDHLLIHFPASFSPHENLTIDEDVCGFRGTVIFRVYIKKTPNKYGIKMFTVCDSKTAYVLRTKVYTGKGQQETSITALFERLLSGYLDKGHTVFMDRFYSSPAVFYCGREIRKL
jgi:hypothetical protein